MESDSTFRYDVLKVCNNISANAITVHTAACVVSKACPATKELKCLSSTKCQHDASILSAMTFSYACQISRTCIWKCLGIQVFSSGRLSMSYLWCAQAGETLQAKLLVVCGEAVAAVANHVGSDSPWGRGRIAVIPKAADGRVN